MEINCRREEINRIGCMWMFINLFGSNQKRLLMVNKRLAVNEKMQLTSSNESVEKLIEEKKKDVDVSIHSDERVESEETFSQMIKRLIAYKEGEIQTCKDLLDAFHVLGSEEESFSHQDAQSLGDSKRVEEEEESFSHQDTQSLGDSKRVEEEEKPEIVIQQKKGRFFRRKWKSRERRERSQDSKTIVVLKPDPNSLDVDSTDNNNNKSKHRRTFSRFLISLIKRRLQSSVGKKPKPCDVALDVSQSCCLQEESQSKSDEKESFYNEDTDSKKTMSGLYIAAKKHLSEMLANGDIDVSLSDKEVPRILGKILSLPEFSSPVDSPGAYDLNPLSQKTEEPKSLQCNSGADDLIDEDLDKQDETLFTIDVSVPTGYEKETENMDKEEKTEIVPSSETCSSSISGQVEFVDEDALELLEEDKQSSKKEVLSETHSSTSPPESPVRSSVMLTESKETAIDVQGKLSPVSVLEPLFIDDDSSPTTSTSFSSAEMRMQPLRIRFEEADSPKPDEDNNVKTSIDDLESALAYIEAVVKSSGLNWEELLRRPFYSEQLLIEQELTEDIIFYSTQLCDDKNLLYDCINEVLIDFCCNELNPGPWISFLKPEIQLISDVEIAAKVAQEGVYWHLQPLPSPHTLDQIVRKDMARTGSWMDLRFEIGCIGSYTGEIILDELVEEVIRSCRDMVQAEPIQDQDQNSNNL